MTSCGHALRRRRESSGNLEACMTRKTWRIGKVSEAGGEKSRVLGIGRVSLGNCDIAWQGKNNIPYNWTNGFAQVVSPLF
jgi:hypothetical protein